jgi:hypothetical protein
VRRVHARHKTERTPGARPVTLCESAMSSIRYNLHFLTLIVAVVIFWLAKGVYLPARIANFDFFHFGLMGLLHSTSIVVSLRDRKAVHPIIALCFIALATIWSAATPIVALWSGVVWGPIAEALPRSNFNLIVLFVLGSAIGSSGYWLLVRLFWLKSLRRADWLKTVALCVAATSLSFVAIEVLKPNSGYFFLMLTVAWWFGFSISLYWSEMSGHAKNSTEAMAHVP